MREFFSMGVVVSALELLQNGRREGAHASGDDAEIPEKL